MFGAFVLKFTPLEFETGLTDIPRPFYDRLKFTPLEFETAPLRLEAIYLRVKIYSVGVWNNLVRFLLFQKVLC